MKLALLSDLHANRHALEACLDHARAHGAQRFAFLGDLVGYGAEPCAVLDTVMHLASEGAVVLKGNHDAMAIRPPADAVTVGENGANWTHLQLNDSHRRFLDALPLTWVEDTVLLVHASADAPERWRYVDDGRSAEASLDAATAWPAVRRIFGGHVHHQTLYYRGTGRKLMEFKPTPGVEVPLPGHRHWLATVGSVGQPRDGDTRAMYALLEAGATGVVFHRVPYDHHAAATVIRAAGLPEFFAQRLENGR
jgi:diadenosine tetraphosphatase ApaH/serine/threonine PP2A family protein phosphatase